MNQPTTSPVKYYTKHKVLLSMLQPLKYLTNQTIHLKSMTIHRRTYIFKIALQSKHTLKCSASPTQCNAHIHYAIIQIIQIIQSYTHQRIIFFFQLITDIVQSHSHDIIKITLPSSSTYTSQSKPCHLNIQNQYT